MYFWDCHQNIIVLLVLKITLVCHTHVPKKILCLQIGEFLVFVLKGKEKDNGLLTYILEMADAIFDTCVASFPLLAGNSMINLILFGSHKCIKILYIAVPVYTKILCSQTS